MLLAILLYAAAPSAAEFQALADADRRLVQIGRSLAKGGAGLCAGAVSNPGWTVGDLGQYRPDLRPAAKAALGLGDYPTVMAVEPNSPAWHAGLRPGDELALVNDADLAEAPSPTVSRRRQNRLEQATAAGLSQGILKVEAGVGHDRGGHDVKAEPGCPSHFLIGRARGLRGVSSDGRRVGISAEMLDYIANDDELALVLAHELAHNILGHNKGVAPTRAAGQDRSDGKAKSREAEADRWALYLMARAGYDVSVAPGFWRRWGPKTSFGIFNAGTHPGWRERAAAAEIEISRIRAQQAAGQRPVP